METNYLFDDREEYGHWIINHKYYNFIKFTRIGIRATFDYLRK